MIIYLIDLLLDEKLALLALDLVLQPFEGISDDRRLTFDGLLLKVTSLQQCVSLILKYVDLNKKFNY
jgi:hypothetical protein